MQAIHKYHDQLKCDIKDPDHVNLLDVARIDLYSETGLRRQVEMLLGRPTQNPDPHTLLIDASSSRESGECHLQLPEVLPGDTLYNQEFLHNLHHYFRGMMEMIVDGRNIRISSNQPGLSSSLLRVVGADLHDKHALATTAVHSSAMVADAFRARIQTVTLRQDTIKKQLGLDLSSEEIEAALSSYGYRIEGYGQDRIEVIVPLHRQDVTSQSDIIDDVFLIFWIGCNHLQATICPQ